MTDKQQNTKKFVLLPWKRFSPSSDGLFSPPALAVAT
jgi:hypothetical protein